MRVLTSKANRFTPSHPFPSRSRTILTRPGHVLQVPTPSKISPKRHPHCHIVCSYMATQTQAVVQQTQAMVNQTQGSLALPHRQGSLPVYIHRRCLVSEPLRGALVIRYRLSTRIDTHTRPIVRQLLSRSRPHRPLSLL